MRISITAGLYIFSLCLSGQLMAQRAADWSAPIEGNGQEVLFHTVTGVPVVQTSEYFVGLDPQKQTAIWKVKRSGLQKLSGVTETPVDFWEVNLTPYAIVSDNVVDTRTGTLILDKESEGYRKIHDYEIIPSLNGVLFRTSAEGMVRLYLVNLGSPEKRWGTDIVKGGEGLGLTEESTASIEVPIGNSLVTKSGILLFSYKKYVVSLDGKTGKMHWNEKAEPAEIFLTPDQKSVIVIERSGGGLMGAMTLGTMVTRSYDKRLYAFDVLTGKLAWKDEIKLEDNLRWYQTDPDHLLCVYSEGCNYYEYATGKPVWKKDFKQKRVKRVEKNAEGHLITYRSKQMQVDAGGEDAWKKAKPLTFDGVEIDEQEDFDYDEYNYESGQVLMWPNTVKFYPLAKSGKKQWSVNLVSGTKVAYDASRKNLVLIYGEKIMIVNPDRYPDGHLSLKPNLKDPYAMRSLELRKNGYFMNSQNEFCVILPESERVVSRYYKEPFDDQGLLLGLAKTGLTATSAVASTRAVMNATEGTAGVFGSTLGFAPPGTGERELEMANRQAYASGMASNLRNSMPPSRQSAFQKSQDFAFFFTKDEQNGDKLKVLVKVDKETGEEVDKLIFDDARPLYRIDEVENRLYYISGNEVKVWNL